MLLELVGRCLTTTVHRCQKCRACVKYVDIVRAPISCKGICPTPAVNDEHYYPGSCFVNSPFSLIHSKKALPLFLSTHMFLRFLIPSDAHLTLHISSRPFFFFPHLFSPSSLISMMCSSKQTISFVSFYLFS